MIRSRNQNSFLAVATLGVYLGLILAGATPSVLAQAATAKQFNVKDEAGRKDELDKKPDTVSDDLLEYDVSLPVADFLRSLQKLHANEKSDLSWEKDFYAVRRDPAGAAAPGRADDNAVEKLATAVVERLDTERLHGLATHAKAENGTSVEFYTFITGIKLFITIDRKSQEDAAALADSLFVRFRARGNRTDDRFRKIVYDNTSIVPSNSQVVIVTRLPRGSLDTLLASNAK